MTGAEQIVDNVIEGRKNEYTRLIAKAFAFDTAQSEYMFSFAFGIRVTMDEDSMIEDGLNPEHFDWAAISDEISQIERNVIGALRGIDMGVRDEGHSDDDLVGSCWIHFRPPHGVAALKLMGDYLKGPEEPMRTSSGTLPSFIQNEMFRGVASEVTKRYADVTLTFFHLGELEKFFDLVHGGFSPDRAIARLQKLPKVEEAFLGAPEPSGVFRSTLGGRTIFSAKCPCCKRIHGNFRTFEQASSNKMCRYCIREYVDKIKKVAEKGNFKSLLKKRHDKARH